MRRLAASLFLAAAPLAAQVQPIADSAATARKAGQWEALGRYVTAYNAAYDATPAKLKTLDSLLVAAAADSSVANTAADKARALLPYNSHPNGAYMARTVLETFGADSLIAGVYSPFRFIRLYAAAEGKRGHAPPFSPASLALLDAFDGKR